MPRYFFDTTDAGTVTRDETGLDLPNDAAARRHAGKLLPDLAPQGMLDGEDHTFACDARNKAGVVIYHGSLTYRGTKV